MGSLIPALGGLIVSVAISFCAFSGGEARAEAHATGAPAEATPTFGAWTLRCGAAPAGGQRACEVDATIVQPGQKGPIAQIAFGRPMQAKEKPADKNGEKAADKNADRKKPAQAAAVKDAAAKDAATKDAKEAKDAAGDAAKEPTSEERTTRLVILVPVNVTIAPGINVIADAAKPPLNLPLKTCIQAACFAEMELKDEQMQAFRGRTQPGQIVFTDPGGKPVIVELPFNGLDQALDELAKH